MPTLQINLEELMVPDLRLMSAALAASTGPRFRRMNEAMAGLLDDYSMVGFSPLDISEEDSVSDLLAEVSITDLREDIAHLNDPHSNVPSLLCRIPL